MKPGKSYDLLKELTEALNATKRPPMKGGVIYQMIVFKVSDTGNWAAGFIPLNADTDPTLLFEQINQAFGDFIEGQPVPNGIIFFQDADPTHLILTVKQWYYGADQPEPNPKLNDRSV